MSVDKLIEEKKKTGKERFLVYRGQCLRGVHSVNFEN